MTGRDDSAGVHIALRAEGSAVAGVSHAAVRTGRVRCMSPRRAPRGWRAGRKTHGGAVGDLGRGFVRAWESPATLSAALEVATGKVIGSHAAATGAAECFSAEVRGRHAVWPRHYRLRYGQHDRRAGLGWFRACSLAVPLAAIEHGASLGIDVDVVPRNEQAKGFSLVSRRWVVARSFGWIMMHRRLARDYETKRGHSESMIRLAMISDLAIRATGETVVNWHKP
jgi:transposase